MAEKLRKARGSPSTLITAEAVRQQTARLIRKHRHHWRKEVTQKGAESWLTQLILAHLAGLALTERHGDGDIIPLPALGHNALRASNELAGAEFEPLHFES